MVHTLSMATSLVAMVGRPTDVTEVWSRDRLYGYKQKYVQIQLCINLIKFVNGYAMQIEP